MRYRKKPVVIEAMQWKGHKVEHIDYTVMFEEWLSRVQGDRPCRYDGQKLIIPTLEGEMTATPGDYVICGVAGEIYPCKPDIFAATYELVEHPMQNEPDYRGALADFRRAMNTDDSDSTKYQAKKHFCHMREDEVVAALLGMAALMGEPSEAEVKAGVDYCLRTSVGNSWPAYITNLRNVMRDQLLKELGNGK